MTIKQQLLKLKENWLLIALMLVLLFFVSGTSFSTQSLVKSVSYDMDDRVYMERSLAGASSVMPMIDEGYYPEIEERKITKTSYISTEVKRGTFYENEQKFKAIVKANDAIILDENINKYGTDRRSYLNGYYRFKVDTDKYDYVVSQLKEIGEIESISENTDDITERYTDLSLEIETEKARLQRYQKMYEEAKEVSDKIELSNMIFNLERSISYMEKSLENMDSRVDYSTISFTLREKRSEYADTALVKISELVNSLVSSFNSLLSLIFVVIPYLVFGLIVWFIYKIFKKKK